jgi:hypothetical protein
VFSPSKPLIKVEAEILCLCGCRYLQEIISVVIQRVINTTTEEKAFSMLFAYIHCWTKDVFSLNPLRDYNISGPVINQKAVAARGGGSSPRQSSKKVSAED